MSKTGRPLAERLRAPLIVAATAAVAGAIIWTGREPARTPDAEARVAATTPAAERPTPSAPEPYVPPMAPAPAQERAETPRGLDAFARAKGMEPEEVEEKFRETRNAISADPTIDEDERRDRIEAIGRALWGAAAEVPPETEEDRLTQEELRTRLAELKVRAERLRDDDSMDREEKAAEIRRLVAELLATSRQGRH